MYSLKCQGLFEKFEKIVDKRQRVGYNHPEGVSKPILEVTESDGDFRLADMKVYCTGDFS